MKKRSIWKKGIAFLLSACMLFGMVPVQTRAAETTSDNVLSAESNHYENGFCVNGKVENGVYVHDADCSYDGCCGYEPPELKEKVKFWNAGIKSYATLSSAYEVGNAGQLYWFAGVVNGDTNVCQGSVTKNAKINCVLTADITINQEVLKSDGSLNEAKKSSFLKWTPIGDEKNDFGGTINGNHHVIRGLYVDENRDYVGLIGESDTYISYGNSDKYCIAVQQLGIEDSYFKGNNYVGAFTGQAYSDLYDCYNMGTVEATGEMAGGIVGEYIQTAVSKQILYCYNRGKVSGTDKIGGIAGDFYGAMASIYSCYNTGEVKGSKNAHMIAGYVPDKYKGRIKGCYYDKSSGIGDDTSIGLKPESFASGEAAYLLNAYNKDYYGNIYRQTIGEDSYPVTGSDSKEVYAQAVMNCDGTASEDSRYTNDEQDESVTYTAHKLDEFGICSVCGKYPEPAYRNGFYEITNAGELYWFAQKINNGDDSRKARIMNDIVVNKGEFTEDEQGNLLYDGKPITEENQPREWIPIGTDNNFYGVIDGLHHSISGLYVNDKSYAGFVGNFYGDYICNLGIRNSYFKGDYAGGIAAHSNNASIFNTYFDGLLNPLNTTYGLIGKAYNSSGKKSFANNYYHIGSKDIKTYQGTEGIEKKTKAAFQSGEVVWLLNQNHIYSYGYWEVQPQMKWGQRLTGQNKDTHPTAYTTENAVYRCIGKYQVCDHDKEPTDYASEENKDRIIEYSYSNTSTQPPEFVNQFQWNKNEDGNRVCSVCGKVQEHENVYSVEEDKHTITANCLYDSSEDRGSLTITAPEYPEGKNAFTYDGNAKEVKVENTIEGVESKVVYTYKAPDSDTTKKLGDGEKPTDAGTYTATVSLKGADDKTASVSVEFTIEQATPVIAWAEEQTKQSAAYTGDEIDVSKLTAPTVTLVNGETFRDTDSVSYSYRKLEGGTASGEFHSGLPTERGTYEIKASIPASGNYTAAEGIMTLEIKWLDLDDVAAALTDQNGKTLNPDMEWWATSVNFTAPEGYTISYSLYGPYSSSFSYLEITDDNGKEVAYYLKNEDGEIGKKTVTVRIVNPENCSHVDEKGTDSEGNETYEPDGFCDKCSTKVKYKVSLTSRTTEDASTSVAELEGGGLVDIGKEITITAPEKEGFQFEGWYIIHGEFEKELAKELSHTFIPGNDLNIVAVYKANGKIDLNIQAEAGAYTVNDVSQSASSFTASYRAGTKFIVAYTGDKEFLYWKNDSGKILSRDKTYRFTLVSAMNLSAVTVGGSTGSEEQGYQALVEFVSAYGQLLQATIWNSKDTLQTLPAGPSKLGGEFLYWSLDGETKATAETICHAITADTKRLTLQPVYKQSEKMYTVTVKYPSDSGLEDDVYTDQKEGSTLTVSAKDVEGKKFAGWSYYENGYTMLSYKKDYFIMISKDVTLYALYKDMDKDVNVTPAIEITNMSTSSVDGKNKINYEITRSIPEQYVVEEQGIIYSISDSYAKNPKIVVGGNDVYKLVSSDKQNNGVFMAYMNVTNNESKTLYVRGYVIMKDTLTGNIITMYTDETAKCYNDLSSAK